MMEKKLIQRNEEKGNLWYARREQNNRKTY